MKFLQFLTSRSGLVKPCESQEDKVEDKVEEQFWASRSGYVKPREGLAGGWFVVAFLGVTLLLGSAQEATALPYVCEGNPPSEGCCAQMYPGQSGYWCCTTFQCREQNGNVRQQLTKSVSGWGCTVTDCNCSCF